MKLLIIVLFSMMLTGCAVNPTRDQPIVIKQVETLILVPDSLLELPEPTAIIDPTTMTDKFLSLWLLNKEERAITLEKKLIAIKAYLDKKKADKALEEASTVPQTPPTTKK